MRAARLVFTEDFMINDTFTVQHLKDILFYMPVDAKIIEIGSFGDLCHITFSSKEFKDILVGGLIPLIRATFKQGRYTTYVSGVDFGDAKEGGTPVSMSTTCSHKWATYRGLGVQYEYCSTCGDKK